MSKPSYCLVYASLCLYIKQLTEFKILSTYVRHALQNKKGTFLETLHTFLPVIYIFLDDFLKFRIFGLQIVLLTNNEFCGKGYDQSATLLEGRK
jgi:hypothetical protein